MRRASLFLLIVFLNAFLASNSTVATLHYLIEPGSIEVFVDTNVPDLDPDPTIGRYRQPAAFTWPAPVPGHDPYFDYVVIDSPLGDSIRLEQMFLWTINPGDPGAVPPGTYPSGTVMDFTYPDGQFSSDAFQPIVFPGALTATVQYLVFDALPPDSITSVTLVPEPSSLILACVGLVGCCWIVRLRRIGRCA